MQSRATSKTSGHASPLGMSLHECTDIGHLCVQPVLYKREGKRSLMEEKGTGPLRGARAGLKIGTAAQLEWDLGH